MVPAIAPRFFVSRFPARAVAPYAGAIGWGPYGLPAPGWRPAPVPWGFVPKSYGYGPYSSPYGSMYPWFGPAAMPYAAWGLSPYPPWPATPYGVSPYSPPVVLYAYAPAYAAPGYPYGGWLAGSLTGQVPLVPPVAPVLPSPSYRPAPNAWPQALPPSVPVLAEPVVGAAELPSVPVNAEPAVEELVEVR